MSDLAIMDGSEAPQLAGKRPDVREMGLVERFVEQVDPMALREGTSDPGALARAPRAEDEERALRWGEELPEKVRLVVELQRIVLPLAARQRALRSWERPWEIEP